jgi:broad specificity phosphatase PhoE
MGLTIYFARHAEAHNPKGILYGRLPSVRLSTTGRDQAGELAAALAALKARAIYSSPLLRARQTARQIAERHPGVPLLISQLLLENRHPYQGRTHAEIGKLSDPYAPDVLGKDGETIAQLRDRHLRFIRRVRREWPDGVVIAVGHADPLAALRTHLLGKPLEVASLRAEAPPLASVFSVEVNGEVDTPGAAEPTWFYRPASTSSGASASGGVETTGDTESAAEADNEVAV